MDNPFCGPVFYFVFGRNITLHNLKPKFCRAFNQGISGNITGLRSDLIICDDVEVPNTCNTQKKRQNLRERLRELDFILSPHGTMIYIGTPHTQDTIYKTK